MERSRKTDLHARVEEVRLGRLESFCICKGPPLVKLGSKGELVAVRLKTIALLFLDNGLFDELSR